jgi:hypothetical protein
MRRMLGIDPGWGLFIVRLQGYMDARLEMLMLCCGLLMFLMGPGLAAIDRGD